MSDAPLTQCPSCGKAEFRKQVTAAGFQLKGSGWYVTDFRGGKAPATGAAPAAAASDTAAAPAASPSSGDAGKSAAPAAAAPAGDKSAS